jgi:hypothetical protein
LKARNREIPTERDLSRAELFLDSTDFDDHSLNWDELVTNFDLSITGRQLRDKIQKKNFFSFIACDKPWISPKSQKLRVKCCKIMLERYPNPKDWHHVRFSDEVHFGWGLEGKTRIIRRRGNGQRGAPTNFQRKEVRDQTDPQKRLHYWGAIGYGFKMQKLVRY